MIRHDPETCRGCNDPEGISREQRELIERDLENLRLSILAATPMPRRASGYRPPKYVWGRLRKVEA